MPDRSNACNTLNERCCRAEYAYPALVSISREEWSPLLSRQLYASRGVYSSTLGTSEVLSQGLAVTAAWVKMHNALPCLRAPLQEAQRRHWLLLTQHIFSDSRGQRHWRALAVLDNCMREEGSGLPTPAAESFTLGLQGTPAGRRQQLQPIKAQPISQSAPQEVKCWTLPCFGLGYTHNTPFGLQKGSPTVPYSHSVALYSLSCLTEPRGLLT